MRPLRLEIEGFTCFRDRQPALDLSRLELFAIAGPTGAGKTSLLDAMIFALFGRVPRTGAQGVGELIALGKDHMSVVLDFRVARETFRVARTVHRARNRPTRVLLERLTVDGLGRTVAVGEALADGVNEVGRRLREVLGFDYETFIRAVVLPQGEFAAFLKSVPSKQREILRELLRLGLYEEMRRRSSRRREDLVAREEAIGRRLDEDYADATEQRVEESQARLSACLAEISEAEAVLEVEERELDALRRRRATSVELEKAREELDFWKAAWQEEGLEDAAERWQAAVRAAPARVLLHQEEEARQRWRARAERRDGALAERRRADRAVEDARRALEEARAAAEVLPRLREERREIDRWLALRGPLRSLEARLETGRLRRETLARELRVVEEALAGAERRRAAAGRQLEVLQRQGDGLGWDEARHDLLAARREELLEIRGVRKGVLEAETRIAEWDAQLEIEKSCRADAAEEVSRAEREEAVSASRIARRAMVEELRSELDRDGACPVCGRPKVDGAEERQGDCATHTPYWTQSEQQGPPEATAAAGGSSLLESAELIDLQEARSALAEAELSLGALRREKETLVARLVRDRRRLSRAERSLAEIGGDLNSDEAMEEGLLERLLELERAGRAHRELKQRCEEAERGVRVATDAAAREAERRTDLLRRLDELDEELESLEAEWQELSQHAGTPPGDDPEGRRTLLEAQIEEIDRDLTHTADTERRAEMKAAEALSRSDLAAVEVVSAEALLRDAELRARDAWEAAGFASAKAVMEAALESEDVKALGRRIEEVRGELEAARRRMDAFDDAEEPVGESEVAAARARLDGRRKAVIALRETAAAIRDRLGELRDRARKRSELLEERAALRREGRIQHRLSRDLRSDAFQAFLLDESFQELVAGASERLAGLVDRYALELEDGRFVVVDHDHGDRRRSADTLSGGETFLASLALALELSEQVQRAAGAVTIDSLFVDEGFGTLDAETLDTVTAAIEALPRSGRMVGIITHLPELTDRLPDRIVVERGPDGSTIRLSDLSAQE